LQFNLHPLFMIIGMIFFYADGKWVFQAAELSADPRISVIPVRVSVKKNSLPRIKNSEIFFFF
jgi:hypothetical protein